MAAPRSASGWRLWEGLAAGLFSVLLVVFPLCPPASGAEQGYSTYEFDVRPGGVVHSFSKSLRHPPCEEGHGCTFTYAAQGGTNEQWQMSIGVSEDNAVFSCSIWRPQGKSYLFFTQFKAEVQGAKIEYGMAYSAAASGGRSDVPLKEEEFDVTETAVSHREGKFRSELSKLLVVAKTARDEL